MKQYVNNFKTFIFNIRRVFFDNRLFLFANSLNIQKPTSGWAVRL